MNLIADTLLQYWMMGRKTHRTPSGWVSGNSACCNDQRGRGGLILNDGNAVSYSCFNCGFKASWQPGRTINLKMRQFMRMLNISNDLILKLSSEAMKYSESTTFTSTSLIPQFDNRALPLGAVPIADFIDDVPERLIPILNYMQERKLYLEDYPFYWTPERGFDDRLIIPFYYKSNIVGYTARTIINTKNPRYFSEQQPGYVFNLDHQTYDRKFVIVCEGPIDAISLDAVAILGNEIKEHQNLLLQNLNREIILVPDRDHAGPTTVNQAIELKWSVSMPDWPDGIKDVNDAVVKLGRLASLWLILQAKESNDFKIKLRAKHWFRNVVKDNK